MHFRIYFIVAVVVLFSGKRGKQKILESYEMILGKDVNRIYSSIQLFILNISVLNKCGVNCLERILTGVEISCTDGNRSLKSGFIKATGNLCLNSIRFFSNSFLFVKGFIKVQQKFNLTNEMSRVILNYPIE